MSDTQKQLEALEATIAKATAEVQVLRTQIEKEAEAAKRPELAPGQIWKMHDGTKYVSIPWVDKTILVNLDNGCTSRYANNGFGGDGKIFTYLGMASDLLTVKEPTK